MSAARIDPPADLLAERRRLGLDRFDEMWEGELHMAPPPGFDHQNLGTRLLVALFPVVERHGLAVLYEAGLFDPEVPGYTSYRVPDVTVFGPELRSSRGVEGPAALVVEVRSPGDESFEKLPYYEGLGVREVLIIDHPHRLLRRWTNGPTGLVEAPGEPSGQVQLAALPVTAGYDAETLVLADLGGPTDVDLRVEPKILAQIR